MPSKRKRGKGTTLPGIPYTSADHVTMTGDDAPDTLRRRAESPDRKPIVHAAGPLPYVTDDAGNRYGTTDGLPSSRGNGTGRGTVQGAPDASRVFVTTAAGVTYPTFNRTAERGTAPDSTVRTGYGVRASVESAACIGPDDASDLLRDAHHYCRTVDATRSRKRDADTGDDVGQDAFVIFADLLAKAGAWPVAACDVETQAPSHWQYVRAGADLGDDDDAATRIVSRATLKRWAIHDAARRNGFRLDTVDAPTVEVLKRDDAGRLVIGKGGKYETERVPLWSLEEGQTMGQAYAVNRPEHLGVGTARVAHGADPAEAERVRQALRNAGGREVRTYVMHALADGAHGALEAGAQACYGGARGSRRQVRRYRDAVIAQAGEVLAHLDTVREATGERRPE